MSLSIKALFISFLAKVKAIWEWLKDLGAILHPCRFSVIMLAVALAVLLLAPQGQDVLREMGEGRGSLMRDIFRLFFFYAAMVFWALSAWYWARTMLRFNFGEQQDPNRKQEERLKRMRKFVPRFLGIFAFVSVAFALYMASLAYTQTNGSSASQTLILLSLICIALASVFYLFTAKRRQAAQWVHGSLVEKQPTHNVILRTLVDALKVDTSDQAYAAPFRSLSDIQRGTWIILALSMLLSCILFVLFLVWLKFAAFLGAATIILLAAAAWIPFGSIVVYFGNAYKFPIITVLIIAIILFSFWNDNHAIRVLPDPQISRDVAHQTVDQHFPNWLQDGLQRWPNDTKQPVFIVAAEGGGIRAAYWTGILLAALQDRDPQFADHVYAISGVSGGSLGAAVFDTLVQEQLSETIMNCSIDIVNQNSGPMQRCAHAILSADFLSPAIAYMLYPDLVQRFLFFSMPLFDRARALEAAWENSWNDQFDSTRFSDAFHNLWQNDHGRVPALFLNSTHVETGKRVIISNLKINDMTFTDSEDFFDIIGADVRLSSAVHNSARFTYVSPAGTVISSEGQEWGHLVDGGYFENSGSATAFEVLMTMRKSVESKLWNRITPVVIMITNDPKLHENLVPESRQFMNEVLSPVVTLLNTRGARGSYSREALKILVTRQDGLFLHFGLHDDHGPLPLGWVLSDVAKQTMQIQLQKYIDELNRPLDLNSLQAMSEQ